MVRRLLETLRDELYFTETELSGSSSSGAQSRRLVDCLPVTNRWGKGIWEGIPDGGVEVSRLDTGRGLERFADVSGTAGLARVSEFLGAGVWRLGTEVTMQVLGVMMATQDG